MQSLKLDKDKLRIMSDKLIEALNAFLDCPNDGNGMILTMAMMTLRNYRSSNPLDYSRCNDLELSACKETLLMNTDNDNRAYAVPDYARDEDYDQLYQQAVELGIKGINTRWKIDTLKRKIDELSVGSLPHCKEA